MKLLTSCMVVIIAVITIGTGIAAAEQDVVILKVAHFLPPGSTFHQKNLIPWCDKINKESYGKLKCQLYPSMQLGGTPAQLFDQARDGVADIVWTVPTYQSGRFTKTEVFELPYMVNSAEQGSQALWDYVQKNSLDEFKGTKLIFTHMHDVTALHFGKKSVKTLEDLTGLKIRVNSRICAKTITALGAIPVQMPAPAVPEAVAKGVVDGVSLPWEVTTSLKLQEITKTTTEVPPHKSSHTNAAFVFAMSQAKYDSLSPDLKKVIDQNSGIKLAKWVGKIWDDNAQISRNIAIDRKNTINILSNAEYNRWVKATEHVREEWFKDVATKGANGKALLNEAKALLEKYND